MHFIPCLSAEFPPPDARPQQQPTGRRHERRTDSRRSRRRRSLRGPTAALAAPPAAPILRLAGRRDGRGGSAGQARLEPRGVRGGENRRVPVVVHGSPVADERRGGQRRVAPAPAGKLGPPSAEDGQVSVYL